MSRDLRLEGLAITLPLDKLEEFCRRWQIEELAVFGSILRDDFWPDSDIDFLYRFAPDAAWSLFDVMQAEEELEKLLQRPVDLVSKKSIEQSHNWLRRQQILSTARIIYVSK